MRANLKSLADFKRFVQTPGAMIQVIRHDWIMGKPKDGFMEPRKVFKFQTNGVAFYNEKLPQPSWLYYDKASKYRFCNDLVTVDLAGKGEFAEVMIYKCWIAE